MICIFALCVQYPRSNCLKSALYLYPFFLLLLSLERETKFQESKNHIWLCLAAYPQKLTHA